MQKKLFTMCMLMLVTSFYMGRMYFSNSISEHITKTLGSSKVDVSTLDEGTYMIDVNGEEGEKMVKVVVE